MNSRLTTSTKGTAESAYCEPIAAATNTASRATSFAERIAPFFQND
jgi:hypothetical protein